MSKESKIVASPARSVGLPSSAPGNSSASLPEKLEEAKLGPTGESVGDDILDESKCEALTPDIQTALWKHHSKIRKATIPAGLLQTRIALLPTQLQGAEFWRWKEAEGVQFPRSLLEENRNP